METILSQRIAPILKCAVLFLFFFTAKVFTTRTNELPDRQIPHVKQPDYVRTFTRYHHRRINHHEDWPVNDHPKVIQKRNADISDSNEFVSPYQSVGQPVDKQSISVDKGSNEKNGVHTVKTYKIKSYDKPKTTTLRPGPTLTCLYKASNIPSTVYDDDVPGEHTVENEGFKQGQVSEEVLPNGETVQVEKCTDPRALCYTLWRHTGEGIDNVTAIMQGCWRSSDVTVNECDMRQRDIMFCRCAVSYCIVRPGQTRESPATMKSQAPPVTPPWSVAPQWVGVTVAVLAALAVAVAIWRRRGGKKNDEEKGDVMGSGPDSLATGLLCVDNLTLIEHIGQGKFGSVWRGRLGAAGVAVKLYPSSGPAQHEAAVYALPGLAHPNLLTYYGSDSRATLEGGGRQHLIVLELCMESLRARLQRAQLSVAQFAQLAHGIAAALAHLHTPTDQKPCIVHRDVNSCNVLVASDGTARLADLGLAQLMPRARDCSGPAPPTRLTEAGTLRYLAPEALEGALDLSGARAALCAVDVYALGLVLWECLWRTGAAHAQGAPPYRLPYAQHGVPDTPTLAQMQSVVSRNKCRPPLPAPPPGCPASIQRALRLAADTCDECWDHDAEARLTAVCVEERMAELKLMLQPHGPVIHDNKLHPDPPDAPLPPDEDKISNCTSSQTCDVTTPLLYPQPHIGRNACIERNTHNTPHTTVELIHKSLKDITVNDTPRVDNVDENCLSVARNSNYRRTENSDRLPEIRSYQRPLLDYVQNDVTAQCDRKPKQTNLMHSVKIQKPKWGIKTFLQKALGKHDTEVVLVPEGQKTMTSLSEKPSNVNYERPPNLVLNQEGYNFEPCTLSPPNRTLSPNMMEEMRETNVFFKELPSSETERNQEQIFAVIVPKSKPTEPVTDTRRKGSSESVNKFRNSVSSQSMRKQSDSEDSMVKKRLSCDNRIISNLSNSASSSKASINLELQYIDNNDVFKDDSQYDLNSDCSSSEDEHLLLLSENDGAKITLQTVQKNEVLKDTTQVKKVGFNNCNKYSNFDNEFSDPNDKENVNGYTVDNPVYLATINGEIEAEESMSEGQKSPKPSLKNLQIKRQHSLEQVSELFSSSGDVNLLNPAGRVKTPGDLPVAVRKARRDRALKKGRSDSNRLSLYDDRMMFGNGL